MRNLKNIKSHFVFSKQERYGIFVLLLLIVAVCAIYFFIDFPTKDESAFSKEELITFQEEIDSLALLKEKKVNTIHPFNPNFISDYKGYVLGMSVEEIDRLHLFRSENKYVNSAKEFQQVTKVSDSLLSGISPYFKFPDWVIAKQKTTKSFVVKDYQKDINNAEVKDLIYAVGLSSRLAYRVINFRNKLGGFVQMSQLKDVYGLTNDDYNKLVKKFQLKSMPKIKKININLASVQELSSLIYIDYSLAQEIVEERQLRDGFKSLDELKFVSSFPLKRLEQVKLYLTLD